MFSKIWYRKVYLQSKHWKYISQVMYSALGRICNRCQSTKNLNLHHKTYENLWNEKQEDFEVLCERCHAKEHGIKRPYKKRKSKINK